VPHLDTDILIWLAGAAFGVWLGLHAARRSARRRIAGNRRRGRRGEARALRLLERAGYRILARQVEATVRLRVDGRRVTYTIRADALVRRGLRRYLVEVKTGAAATPAHPATRRQLLEYARAFGCRRLLLVDADRARILRIEF